MIYIKLAEITPEALKRFSKIYVVSTDKIHLVWDSHRMLPWTDPSLPATLIEEGAIRVTAFESDEIEPIKARVVDAGGARGVRP